MARRLRKTLRDRLKHSEQVLGRRIAVDAFEQCDGDLDEFERLVQDDTRLAGLDPALIALLIQLAVMFFKWWSSRAVKFPSRETQFRLPDEADAEIEEPIEADEETDPENK